MSHPATESTPPLWLNEHAVFVALRGSAALGRTLAAYVEGFAPVVNSVPVFLHSTITRADGHARTLLLSVWDEEMGDGQSLPHPVLFERLHRDVTARFGHNRDAQRAGTEAAIAMIRLCSGSPWPLGVAAMRAHESQFATAYASALPELERQLGRNAEFFRVHAGIDINHSDTAASLLKTAIAERIVSSHHIESAFDSSTAILKNLMDSIWRCSERAS